VACQKHVTPRTFSYKKPFGKWLMIFFIVIATLSAARLLCRDFGHASGTIDNKGILHHFSGPHN
jgi:hypothetical protein